MAGEEWPRPQALTRQAESAITEPVAGRYVLICNMAGHHQAGMRAPFTVRLSFPLADQGGGSVSVAQGCTGGADGKGPYSFTHRVIRP